jgi:hypothetical protein
MVKIKRSPSKKQYLRGKQVYEYWRLHFPIPHKFFKKLEPYFKEDFQVEMIDDENKVILSYSFFKNTKIDKVNQL